MIWHHIFTDTTLDVQTHECLLRYLRASKWNLDNANQRLEDTLKWRREFGLYDKVNAAHVEPEVSSRTK